MSTETTTAAAPKSVKLPANFFYKRGEDIVTKASPEIVAATIKRFGINENIGEKAPDRFVSELIVTALRAHPKVPELPEGLEDADTIKDSKGNKLSDFVVGFVASHMECKAELEEADKALKQKKAEEREAAKKEKEEENKRFQQEQDEFGEMFEASIKKYSKASTTLPEKVLTLMKLGDKISLSGNGLGLTISKGATKQDVANALASTFSVYEGLSNAEAAIQFLVGDLVNQSIESKVYRTQSDASNGIKMLLQEKCGKKFNIGTISQYAMMAARIPAEQRVIGIRPSLYLAAAKITPPSRNRGDSKALTEEQLKIANKEAEEFRAEIVEEINKGELNTKTLDEKIVEFKKSKGWVKEQPVNTKAEATSKIIRAQYAQFMISNLANKNDQVIVARGKESHIYNVTDLYDIVEEGREAFTKSFIEGEYDLQDLLAGFKTVEKNGKKNDVPYRISDPFFTPEKKGKSEEPAQVPTTAVDGDDGEKTSGEDSSSGGFGGDFED